MAVADGLTLSPQPGKHYVECEGIYSRHLQGIATNGTDAIFWSFTDKLVKTDAAGKILRSVDVPSHHGDLTHADGKIYVAVNLGPFNQAAGGADSWIYEYDAGTLERLARHAVPEVVYGAGGLTYHEGRFFVVGGLPKTETKNFVYEYSDAFAHLATHELPTGYTDRGIQVVTFAHDHWWLCTYHSLDGRANTRQVFKVGQKWNAVRSFSFDAPLGLEPLSDGRFLVGLNRRIRDKGFVGRVELAEMDETRGLKIVPMGTR